LQGFARLSGTGVHNPPGGRDSQPHLPFAGVGCNRLCSAYEPGDTVTVVRIAGRDKSVSLETRNCQLQSVAAFAYFCSSAAGCPRRPTSVKDSSGAVLPGVNVEATSHELIEKIRTAITDGTGQYRIEDL
jgi:hypothetical protein